MTQKIPVTKRPPADSAFSIINVVTFNGDFANGEKKFMDDLEILMWHTDFILLQEVKYHNMIKLLDRYGLLDEWGVFQNTKDQAHMGSAIVYQKDRGSLKWFDSYFGVHREDGGMLDRYIARAGIKIDDAVLINFWSWHNPPWRYRLLIGPMTKRVIKHMGRTDRIDIGGADFNESRKQRLHRWKRSDMRLSKHQGIDGLVWTDRPDIMCLQVWEIRNLHSDHNAAGVTFKIKHPVGKRRANH